MTIAVIPDLLSTNQIAAKSNQKRVFTLHLSSMKAAKHTSLTLLGTTITNCFKASGIAKLWDCLAAPPADIVAEHVVRSEEVGSET